MLSYVTLCYVTLHLIISTFLHSAKHKNQLANFHGQLQISDHNARKNKTTLIKDAVTTLSESEIIPTVVEQR